MSVELTDLSAIVSRGDQADEVASRGTAARAARPLADTVRDAHRLATRREKIGGELREEPLIAGPREGRRVDPGEADGFDRFGRRHLHVLDRRVRIVFVTRDDEDQDADKPAEGGERVHGAGGA